MIKIKLELQSTCLIITNRKVKSDNIIQAEVNTTIIEHRTYKLILIEVVRERITMILRQDVGVWFLERVLDMTRKIKAWNLI